MKTKIHLLFILFIIQNLFALELHEILDKTSEKYNKINDFYAEFTQVMCDELSGTCQLYEGKIFFKRPNFFRMEIGDPPQIYVGDSSSLWIYMPEKKRAIRQNLGQIPIQISPDIFLKDYDKRFNVEFVGEEKKIVQIALIPKQNTDIYSKIIVDIHKSKCEIKAITIRDHAGQENKFTFDKIETNKKLSKELFEFKPPEGTQVDEF
ncbi:MAG: outer membrane lipoprotein chaperone LolA [bacterium]